MFPSVPKEDLSLILSTQEHQEIMEKVASDCSSNFSLPTYVTSVPAKTGLPKSIGNEVHLTSKLIEELFDSRKAEAFKPPPCCPTTSVLIAPEILQL